tara:strand:- start:7814 stop:8620 length:807 start_codon:yes stop_codon:yes gene_type:complete
MIYKQASPKKELSEIIKSFWLIDGEGDVTIHKEKIIPDGYPELIFHYGDPYKINISGRWELQAKEIIAGQIRNYFFLENTGESKMFAIKFQPWALQELFQLEMSSITDHVIVIPNEMKVLLSSIQEIVAGELDFEKKVAEIEKWFSEFLEDNKIQMDEKYKVVESILENKGNIQLSEIQTQFNISERSLERYFKRYVGLSPKFYSRIIRFSHIFQLVQEEAIDWADIVFKAGYYDQSHFIKNFKEFTGEDPSKYGFSSETMANFLLKK